MKKVIEINDVSPIVLSGANDENIKLIEQEFSSLIILRGNKINLDGKKKEIDLISKIFQGMVSIAVKKEHVTKNYNFQKFQETWVQTMDEIYETEGSWETRKGYNGIRFMEVA